MKVSVYALEHFCFFNFSDSTSLQTEMFSAWIPFTS